jgi:hypothetical protein
MPARTPKANYKIFDKKLEKYVSAGYRSKTTWSSKVWVMEAAREHCRHKPASYLENIEIHIFPIENAIKVSYKEMEREMAEDENKKKDSKKKREDAQSQKDLINRFLAKKKELSQLGEEIEKKGIQIPRIGKLKFKKCTCQPGHPYQTIFCPIHGSEHLNS